MRAVDLTVGTITATGAEVTRVEVERSGSEAFVRYYTRREVAGQVSTYEFTCKGDDEIEVR